MKPNKKERSCLMYNLDNYIEGRTNPNNSPNNPYYNLPCEIEEDQKCSECDESFERLYEVNPLYPRYNPNAFQLCLKCYVEYLKYKMNNETYYERWNQ